MRRKGKEKEAGEKSKKKEKGSGGGGGGSGGGGEMLRRLETANEYLFICSFIIWVYFL